MNAYGFVGFWHPLTFIQSDSIVKILSPPRQDRMSADSITDAMDDSSEPSLLTYLDELVRHLAAQVSAALLAGEVGAVHQSRVATRRLGAAMKLLQPVIEKKSRKRLERSLKKMRRRLGSLRDLDVMMDHLAELRVNSTQPDAIDWLQKQLSSEREEAQQVAIDEIPLYKTLGQLEHWRVIRAQVHESDGAVDSLIGQSLHNQIDAFALAAKRIAIVPTPPAPLASTPDATDADPAHRNISKVEAEDDPKPDPHQVRIEGKALRYTLEMADAAGHSLAPKVFKAFKSMQDSLGSWHDNVVLAESIMRRSADEMLAHHDVPLQMQVLRLAMEVLTSAQRDLEKFNKQWRDKGDSLVLAIRAAFPLARDVQQEVITESHAAPLHLIRSKKDHDPADSGASEVRAAASEDSPPTV